MRVLIVGGYGTFGARLVRLLANEATLQVIVAGRSFEKARRFCSGQSAAAALTPVAFDRDGDLTAQLSAVTPDIVVDASGPFQSYRDDPYRFVKACIAMRTHYLDLADAIAFVDGIAAFDHAARTAGVFVLSGASTFPALSSAVIRLLAHDVTPREIEVCIAPSPHAGIGRNVIAAIAGYAGKRVGDGYGLIGKRRITIAPPGYLPLKARWFARVDVPDIALARKQWPDARTVWTGAGTAPVIWFRGLTSLAWLVRLRILPSLSALAGLFHFVGNRLVWGEHRGGMFVRVRADGEVMRSWHMIAEGDDGPFVPAIAAYAILRKCLADKKPPSGARASVAELALDDFQSVFDCFNIVTGMREQNLSDTALPLYQQFLGPAYAMLPEPIRVLHNGIGTWQSEGRAVVERGRSPLARLAAVIMGFPKPGTDVPVSVRFDSERGHETWTRNFAGKEFTSVQSRGRGRFDGLMCERFGPLTFAMALVLRDGKLHLVQRGWSAFGIPLPMFLAPVGNTFESAQDGQFHFHVEIGLPWTGLIVRYRGWLRRS